MTERLRRGSYAYAQAAKVRGPDLGPRKTVLVLVIVVGCFAVLWPKVFYPMLIGSAQQHIKPSPIDRTTGCCDVISETDVNTIRIMTELCRTIIVKDEENAPLLTNKELIVQCQKAVLDTCGIDISAVLQEQVRLGQNTKQILNEIRSLNGSLCLKYNFGVSPGTLGVPHRVTIKLSPSSIKQERPPHLRSEMIHPAFRERGRAIPQTQTSSPSRPPPKIVEGRPGPIPGMRPTMGGAGHVVPSKQTTSTMGLVMPVYTIGIVIFFTYTVMKILFKKQPEALYPPIDPDPIFRREVFEANRGHLDSKLSRGASNKLVVNAMSALLDEVDQELAARRKASESTEQDIMANGKLHTQEDQTSVKVMGMEMRASCEGNQKWSRADSPVLPTSHQPQPQSAEPPHEIYLEGALPPQSNHLLVADSATEAQKISTEDDPAVVLAGKMTLSVISLDSSENGTDESAPSKKIENRRSSCNVSDDFEKIELDDQIIDIIQEAQNIVTDENDSKEISDLLNSTLEDMSVETIQDQLEIVNQHILKEIDKESNNLKNDFDELQVPEERAVVIEKVQETKDNQDVKIDPTLDLKLSELVIQDTYEFLQTEKSKTEEIELDQKLNEERNLKETIVESKKLNEENLQPESSKTEEDEPVQKLNEELQEDKTETVESRLPNEGLANTVKEFETVDIKDSAAKLSEAPEEKNAATISNEKLNRSNELQDTPKVDSEVLEQLELKSETTSDTQQMSKDSKKSNDKDITEHKTESNIGFESTKQVEVVEKFDTKTEEAPSEETIMGDEIMKKACEGLNLAVSALSTELKPNKTETVVSSGKIQEDVPQREGIVDQNPVLNEVIDDDQEEVEYEYEEGSENENIDDEIRNLDRISNLVNEEPVERINGEDRETSNTILTELDISDGDNLINDEDDENEVEEVIEYITDEEEMGNEPNNVNHIDSHAAHAN